MTGRNLERATTARGNREEERVDKIANSKVKATKERREQQTGPCKET